jgi:hypothetical protein
MDDVTYQIKNLEFHLKQISQNHDKCISKAIRGYMETDHDIKMLMKPCETIKENMDVLLKKYDELNILRMSTSV